MDPTALATLLAGCLLAQVACTDTTETPAPNEAASPPSASTEPIEVSTLEGRIVFSAGPPYGEDIYVVSADGTGLTQVTDDPAAEFDPTWSPDGRLIAFRYQPGDDRATSIHVIEPDGTGRRDVTGADNAPDWGPTWSPDGRWITWNTARGLTSGFELGLVHPNGRGRRVVQPGIFIEYAAWSPDGERIAFMSQVAEESSQYDIFVMDADGSNVQRLTDFRGDDGWPSWSPDGEQILFTSVRDDCLFSAPPECQVTEGAGEYHTLYVMNADGSDETRVSLTFGQIADWSPDGRYIVFEDYAGMGSGLSVMRPDGSGLTVIPLPVSYPGFPDWIA